MSERIQKTILDLKEVAASTKDPEKITEIMKLIERLSCQEGWPDENELMRIRLRYGSEQD